KLIEGPVPNAYIPIIYLDENNKEELTVIDGTAVIKKDRMVGELDKLETAGLNLLLNNVKGGSIQVNLDDAEDEKVSIEISKLKKLQQEYQTDITKIGTETYKKYPKEWHRIHSDWDEIFANANVTIDVQTNITHQGLINRDIEHHEKPYNNPYRFFK